jgi:hypothetical protein
MLPMRLQTQDKQYITDTLPTFEGWLLDDAAYFTSALVRWQREAGVEGGLFEIGVYAGKYLSLLYHLSQQTNERVLGLDTFQWYPREKVADHFKGVFGESDRLTLMVADSTKVTPGDIVGALGGKPSFISVDGAHTSQAVLNDLRISEEILTKGGIMAIDDILNPRAIGVSEGAYRYFLSREGSGLAPFAYCANKLYVAHRSEVDRFRGAAWQFITDNPGLEICVQSNKLLEKGRHWVEQPLFGYPVVIL